MEGRLSTGIYGLLDVVILSAFAIAVLKRHLWAAYALVGYGLCNYVVSVRRGEPWAAFFVIYLIAAWFLRKKPHVAPETIRTLRWRSIIKYAIAWFAGFEILALIFGLVRLAQGDLVEAPRWVSCTFSCLLCGESRFSVSRPGAHQLGHLRLHL